MKTYFLLSIAIIIISGEILHSYFFYSKIKEQQLITKEQQLESLLYRATFELNLANDTLNEAQKKGLTKILEQFAERNDIWQISLYEKIDSGWFLMLSSEIPEYFANGTKMEIDHYISRKKMDALDENLFHIDFETFDITYTLIKNIEISERDLLAIIQKKDIEHTLQEALWSSASYGILFILLYIPIVLLVIYGERFQHKKKIERFEKSLRYISKSRKRDRLIKDNIHCGIIILSRDYKIKNANSYILKKLNYSLIDIIGENIFNIIDAHFHAMMREYLLDNQNRDITSIKIKLKSKLGEDFFFVVNLINNHNKKDLKKEVILTLEDKTEVVVLRNELTKLNQNLEKKIEEKVRYTRGILNSQNTLIFIRNKNRILDANRAFLEFFGNLNNIEEFRAMESDIFDMFEKCDEEGYVYNFEYKDLMAYLLINKNYKHKVKIRKNHKTYIFDITADYFEFLDEYERIGNEQFIITLSDITEFELLRQEEINLAKLTSIGKLTAGITHEINTPLTYMKGNIEIAKLDLDDIEDENVRKSVETNLSSLYEGVKRLESIVKSMQEFVGLQDTNKEPINIVATIIVSLRMLHNRIKHISNIYLNGELFTIDLDPQNLEREYLMLGVRQKLEQVWIILINNALDEFSESNIPFEERFLNINIEETKESIIISFADNAGGIDSQILDKIFDPLISTKTSSGMGLGLNIAKKIIEEHKGTIAAKNIDDNAVFELCFPTYIHT